MVVSTNEEQNGVRMHKVFERKVLKPRTPGHARKVSLGSTPVETYSKE